MSEKGHSAGLTKMQTRQSAKGPRDKGNYEGQIRQKGVKQVKNKVKVMKRGLKTVPSVYKVLNRDLKGI